MNMKHEYREFLPSLVTLTCILTKLCSFLTTKFSVKNMTFYKTLAFTYKLHTLSKYKYLRTPTKLKLLKGDMNWFFPGKMLPCISALHWTR